MLVTTGGDFPGYRTVGHVGEIFGLTVRPSRPVSVSGASNTSAEELGLYMKMLTEARNETLRKLRAAAVARRANAVVWMRMDANVVGDGIIELIAYGTAVTIEPVERPALA